MRRLIVISLIGLALTVASAADGKRVELFAGTYDWSDGGRDELRAEFKPAADGWKVKFEFRFGGKSRTWKGTAAGNLGDGGTVSGTVDWSGRTWEFEGTVEDGVLRGSHTEIQRGGSRYDTGTFELERQSASPGKSRANGATGDHSRR